MHKYKEYLAEIEKDISDLMNMRPNPEKVKIYCDYMKAKEYITDELMKHDDHMKSKMTMSGDSDSKNPY